ncbi:MAG: hypothetical protein EAZ92_02925 [Candidatus Kapaibacterium sp.]|nr:MAG: hypothetical protein EAZ92_02925 [Candidatus Kapabacteria bacterium]
MLCRIRSFRKVHNIPEPNFAGMKRHNLAAKLHHAEMQTRTELFDLVQRLEHLEQFTPSAVKSLTDVILQYPRFVVFYPDKQEHGTQNKIKRLEVHGKRLIAHNRDSDVKIDTAQLKEWSYLTEDEQFDYVYFAYKYAYQATRHHIKEVPTRQNLTIPQLEEVHRHFLDSEGDILERVRKEKKHLEQEIARLKNASQRRVELFHAPNTAPIQPISQEQNAVTTRVSNTIPAQSSTMPNIIITTAAQLEQKHLPNALPLPKPFSGLLGRIPHNPYIILWGDAGSGKTGFTLHLLNALRKHDKALLCTAEASLSGADSPLVMLAHLTKTKQVLLAETPSIEAVEQIIATKQYPFLAVDSASRLGLTPEKVLEWRKLYPASMLVLLMESTKSGNEFKGDNAWKHHCNIMIRAESLVNEQGSRTGGRYVVEKNQYGAYGEMRL